MHFIIKIFLTQDVLECTRFLKVKFDNKKSYKIRAGKHFRNLKVFKFRVGRTDIGGDANLMKQSLQNLLTQISEDTVLCPGHGRYTTLKKEKNFYQSVMKELA